MSILILSWTGTEKPGRAGIGEVVVGVVMVMGRRWLIRNKTMQFVKIINGTWPTDTIQYIFLG